MLVRFVAYCTLYRNIVTHLIAVVGKDPRDEIIQKWSERVCVRGYVCVVTCSSLQATINVNEKTTAQLTQCQPSVPVGDQCFVFVLALRHPLVT